MRYRCWFGLLNLYVGYRFREGAARRRSLGGPVAILRDKAGVHTWIAGERRSRDRPYPSHPPHQERVGDSRSEGRSHQDPARLQLTSVTARGLPDHHEWGLCRLRAEPTPKSDQRLLPQWCVVSSTYAEFNLTHLSSSEDPMPNLQQANRARTQQPRSPVPVPTCRARRVRPTRRGAATSTGSNIGRYGHWRPARSERQSCVVRILSLVLCVYSLTHLPA